MENTLYLRASQCAGMVDRTERLQHAPGVLTEFLNPDTRRGTWAQCLGWRKMHQARMPWDTACGAHNYWDTAGVHHWLVAGGNGILYHAIGDDAPGAWGAVAVYAAQPITWGELDRVVFAEWRDDCFLTVSRPPEAAGAIPVAGTQNLRFAGLSGAVTGVYAAFGVSLVAPGAGVAAADGGAGNIAYGDYNYFCTFYCADTGWESDRSPITAVNLARPDPPTEAPVPVDNGVGLMAAGRYEYGTTFYQPATGIETTISPLNPIDLAALRQARLTNIQRCPDPAAGWQRRVWRRSAGGAIYLLAAIADNTTEAYNDNNVAIPPSGVLYADNGRQIAITNVPICAEPAGGRVFHRRIYREDNGSGTYHLVLPNAAAVSTIQDNVAVVYNDNLDVPLGGVYVRQVPIPCAAAVAVGPDNRVLWFGDRADVLPANIYLSRSDEYPEARALLTDGDTVQAPLLAGTQVDPITAARSIRDGVWVSKRRGYYWIGRECARCERVIEDRGNVSPQTTQPIDTRLAVLTAEGPGYISHYSEGDFRFVGPDPERFCLAETWEQVVKDRLFYATSVHWRRAGLIIWGVQMCNAWPSTAGPHNDTAILWDYGCANSSNPGGHVAIMTLVGWDAGFAAWGAGSASDHPFGAFAMGFVGRMFDGQHGNGTTGNLVGTVIAATGTSVWVPAASLAGENVVGSVLYINGGTGTRICRPRLACEDARGLIVSQSGGLLRTAGELAISAGSEFWIGGIPQFVEFMVNDNDPDAYKTYLEAKVMKK